MTARNPATLDGGAGGVTQKLRVVFYGGRRGRMVALMTETPARVTVEDEWFARVDDPDTGEPLGAYCMESDPGPSA